MSATRLPTPAWAVYLALGLTAIGFYYLLPTAGVAQAVLLTIVNACAAACALTTAGKTRGRTRTIWLFLGIASALSAAANAPYYGLPLITGHALPFPSAVDVLWLLTYPCFVVALYVMTKVQCREARRGNALDTTILVISGTALMSAFVLEPIIRASGIPLLAHVVGVAYPAMDVLVFAMLVRFAVAVSWRNPSVRLLLISFFALLFADTVYALQLAAGTYHYGGATDGLWMVSYLLVGVAAVHPQARQLAHVTSSPGQRLSPARLAFLCASVLTGPILAVTRPTELTFATVVSVMSFLLVMARMTGLNRALASTTVELESRASTDSLTGLPNRRVLAQRLEAETHALAAPITMMLIDLDGFKTVNDSLGHDAGDALLIAVAGRLSTQLRPTDVVARLGGDEFAVLAPGLAQPAAAQLADRLLRRLDEPFEIEGRQVFARASIGVAVRAVHGHDDELLRDADTAMYEAKRKGGKRFELFSPDIHARVQDRLALESDLRSASFGTDISVHYQPLVHLRSGRVTGFEALLRWQHPERGMVPPDVFIPIAEETGAILALGRWVLEQACLQARRWGRAHPHLSPFGINVNVSARQLRPEFVAEVARILDETGLDPADLTLEITETMIMADEEAARVCLQSLKRLGVRISVDDFGTGFSSLGHLERFPIDELKIDKSFVASLGAQSANSRVAAATIRLAKSLRIDVVAEGIETDQQLAALRRSSCTRGQGYRFWRPMPADAVDKVLVGLDHPLLPPISPVRVLVVDDDETLRRSVERILEEAGFEALQAPDGQTALDIASLERLDAVILDVHLPDIDGIQICQRLKEDPDGPVVVQLSGSAATVPDRVRGLDAGADAYLVKPVSPGELIATLRAVLRTRSAANAAA